MAHHDTPTFFKSRRQPAGPPPASGRPLLPQRRLHRSSAGPGCHGRREQHPPKVWAWPG
ncbi:Hypothetical predicted protein, partial [Olea europaea subsp. europaea]